MSTHRYPGGVISATPPTATSSAAVGVWTLEEALRNKATGNWPDGSGADPYFKYNTLLVHGDGTNGAQNNTFLDGSTNNYTITRNGNATQGAFTPYLGPGNFSVYYGSAQCGWQTPANSITGILGSTFSSTATFTVEAWIYPVARHSGGGSVLGYVFGSLNIGGSNADWAWGPDSNGNLVLFWYQGGNQICKGSSVIPLNTWTHIALSVSSGAIKLFVNGVLETTTGPTTINLAAPALTYVSSGGYLYGGTTWQGFNGYISNLRVIGKRAAYTATFTPSTTPLVATSDTTLLTNNQNSFTDMSAARWALTLTNANLLAISKFSAFTMYEITPASYSGYFDGTGDYLSVPAGPAFNFGTGDFCIEMWVYPIAQSTYGALLSFDAGDYPLIISWASAVGTDIQFNAGSSTAWFISGASFGTTVKNKWTHLVVTRSGNAFRTFQDGVLRSYNSNAGSIGDSSGNIYLASNGTSGYATQASLSNVRIIKGSVPTSYQTSSTTLGTTIFTTPTSPLTTTSQGATEANVSLLTCQSTTFIDNSTNAFAITANGNASPKTSNPFTDATVGPTPYTTTTYGGSTYLDGNGDYLNLPAGTGFNFGTSDFTIEAWVYPITRVTNSAYIISQSSYGVGTDFAFWITSSGILQLYLTTGSVTISSASTIPLYAWTHVAVSRSGTSFKIFVNGVLDGSGTSSVSVTNTYTPATIGNSTNNTGSVYFFGYISNLRVVKGTAVYTAPFVPPAAPVTAITNTQFLLDGANGGIFDNTSSCDLETTGTAQISTSVVKVGSGSIACNATSGLSTPNNQNFAFGAGDFTIECWFYRTSAGGAFDVIMTYGWPAINGAFALLLDGSTLKFYASSNGSTWDISNGVSMGTITNGQWVHAAVSRQGSSIRLFTNGVLQNTVTSSSAFYGQLSYAFTIGVNNAGTSAGLIGYIDEVRVTKGYARYTANFTPSTTPYPNF